MKPIPLFGSGVTSYSMAVTRQRRVNCMYDIRKDGDKEAIVVVGTPGAYVWATLPTAPVRGYRVVGSSLFVVAGTSLYRVSSGGAVALLGSMPTVSRKVGMSDNSIQIIIVDGIAGYVYSIATGAITLITDTSFPNGATSVAFLNSRFIVEYPSSRQFNVSALLDGTTWSPGIYGTKENSSDLLVRAEVLNGTLVLMGDLSLEFWQDTGGKPLPYSRINGASQQWGLAAVNSVAHLHETLMFLGKNPDGGVSVIILNGYTPSIVSDSDIEFIMQSFSTVADAVAMVYHAFGHTVYQLTFPSAGRTLAYDLETKIWHEAQTGLAPARHFGEISVSFANHNVFSDATTGNLYFVDTATYTDAGQATLREVCTRNVRMGGNEIFLNQLLLEIESGVSVGNVSIEVSRDGGRTFGPQKTRPLGPLGQYLSRAIFRRLGRSRDFVIRIRVTDPLKFIMSSGSVDYEMSQ
jgi:hypothetical protein